MSQENNTYIWLQQIKVAKGNCYTTFIGFSRFITNNLVLLYEYECHIRDCYVCYYSSVL